MNNALQCLVINGGTSPDSIVVGYVVLKPLLDQRRDPSNLWVVVDVCGALSSYRSQV